MRRENNLKVKNLKKKMKEGRFKEEFLSRCLERREIKGRKEKSKMGNDWTSKTEILDQS